MSADDQRAAEDRADAVMTELHECAEGANPYGGIAARALALIHDRDEEVDRLRAELAETRAEVPDDVSRRWLAERDEARKLLAETRAAGDKLAAALERLHDATSREQWARSDGLASQEAFDAWWSVRGDAPGESVSWNDLHRATATIRRVMPSDATTVICGADVEEVSREKLPCGAFRVTTRRRGDAPAPAEPPATEPQLPDTDGWTHLGDIAVKIEPAVPHLVDAAAPAMRKLLDRVARGEFTADDARDVLLDWPNRAASAAAPAEPLDEGSDPGAHFDHDPDVCGCEPPAVEPDGLPYVVALRMDDGSAGGLWSTESFATVEAAEEVARSAGRDRSVYRLAPLASASTEAYAEGYRRGAKAQADICEAEHVDLGPAVELPVTLSSVDDVAAVCLAHGLTEKRGGWSAGDVTVTFHHEDDEESYDDYAQVSRRDAEWKSVHLSIATVNLGAPSSLLVAAIEAARGGSR